MPSSPIVTTEDGKLRGVVEKNETNTTFFSFMGIPYAKPPVEELKFKAPQPVQPWEGILDTKNENNQCLSKDFVFNKIVGDFDCLYLNVFTPHLPNKQNESLKPVMVWIPGGGFIFGSKNRVLYGPEYFIDKDVVIVAINYRLGVLGFLSLQDPSLGVSGNAGLKDQVMALKWVQRNIAAFGGDRNNVTIFGESAGAASVSYLHLSPMCKGLFHKAIIQSGVATCLWAEGRTGLAKNMVTALGKIAANEAEMLSILQNATKKELIEAQLKVPDTWKPCEKRYLAPTVETSTSEERFLSDTPLNILKSGNYNKVPVILGCTSNEGLLLKYFSKTFNITLTNDEEYIPHWLNVSKDKTAVGKSIKDFYFGRKVENEENLQCLYNYTADVYFCLPTYFYANDLLNDTNHSVYLYWFDSVTCLNQTNKIFKGNQLKGAGHGDDLMYLFKNLMSLPVDGNSEEFKLIQSMTTWWTNFAKYGNPNSSNNRIEWPKAGADKEYLHICSNLKVETQYGKKSMEFWKTIGAPY